VDTKTRKSVLRMFTYGVYLLTVKHGDKSNASTVSWVCQASFEPSLLTVALRDGSLTQAMVEAAGQFALNLVATNQKEMAGAFVGPAEQQVGKLSGYAYEPGPETGAPVFLDAPAWLECKVVDRVKRGDHTVVVAEVVGSGVRDATAATLPLRDTPWHYSG
jgi:flavin reductase (DIM6/NTAB) family NADH-FMN oxidoreductase RutF